jgi:hypothetical protein
MKERDLVYGARLLYVAHLRNSLGGSTGFDSPRSHFFAFAVLMFFFESLPFLPVVPNLFVISRSGI